MYIYALKQGHKWICNIPCSFVDLLGCCLVARGHRRVARLSHGGHISKAALSLQTQSCSCTVPCNKCLQPLPTARSRFLFLLMMCLTFSSPLNLLASGLNARIPSDFIGVGLQTSLNQLEYVNS